MSSTAAAIRFTAVNSANINSPSASHHQRRLRTGRGVGQSGAHNRLYVANSGNGGAGSVSVISCVTNAVLNTVTLPQQGPGQFTPTLIAANPANNNWYLVCKGQSSGQVFVYNLSECTDRHTAAAVGKIRRPVCVVDPISNHALITYGDSGTIDVLDGLATNNFSIVAFRKRCVDEQPGRSRFHHAACVRRQYVE